MAENPFKSKLKRKKLSAEDLQTDINSRGTQKKSHGDRTAEPGRSVPVWWSSEQLPAVEALWASALKSALPYLQDQSWDPVPDLPEPSSARAPEEDDQRWCDLREDVAPFPEPSIWTPPSPGPPEGQQDAPVQTQPGPDTPERGPSSLSRTSLRTSLQPVCRRSESVGGDKERKEGDRGEGQLLQSQRRVSDSPVFMEEEEEHTGGLMEEEEEQRSVGGAGEALKSCPMCMLVFPAGFTQMDRDGHLAQCLSEVNDDITW